MAMEKSHATTNLTITSTRQKGRTAYKTVRAPFCLLCKRYQREEQKTEQSKKYL